MSSVNQAAWVPNSANYQFGYNSIPNIPITGAPADTNWRRWSMLHDGSVYRMYFFKGSTRDTLYQFGWNGSTYAYGAPRKIACPSDPCESAALTA